jgi:hypothetical protein
MKREGTVDPFIAIRQTLWQFAAQRHLYQSSKLTRVLFISHNKSDIPSYHTFHSQSTPYQQLTLTHRGEDSGSHGKGRYTITTSMIQTTHLVIQ